MIDLSTVKLGDEVTVRGKVVSSHRPSTNGCLYVEISENCQGYVERSAIVSHAPKALAVGDRVSFHGQQLGFIRAILGNRAWVDLVDDPDEHLNGCTYGLANLERVDA